MKTVITIENNPIGGTKLTIQVDDSEPAVIKTTQPATIKLPDETGVMIKPPPKPPKTPNKLEITSDPRGHTEPNLPYSKPTKETECADCGLHFYSATGKRKLCPSCVAKRQQAGREKRYKERHAVRAGNPTIPMPKPNPPVPLRSEVDDPDSEAGEVTRAMKQQRANFSDPWDCNMCRNAGDLCIMHEGMTKSGQKPPKLYGVPS